MLPDLLHGEEKKVWGDTGYQGQGEVIHAVAPNAQDMTSRRTRYKDGMDENQRRKNRTKARVRPRVEWPFRILKRVFGFTKVRYRGLKKNHEWLLTAFALVNLYQHRKRLDPLGAWCLWRLGNSLRKQNSTQKNAKSRSTNFQKSTATLWLSESVTCAELPKGRQPGKLLPFLPALLRELKIHAMCRDRARLSCSRV